MKPVDSTAEILIWKHFNKSVDEKWSFWAVDMMMAGFDTEHIVELAGISKPYNQFELGALTDRVFNELRIDFSDQQSLIKLSSIKSFKIFICSILLRRI